MAPVAGGLRITVDSGEIGTRTTEQVDGVGRENLINTIDYFLFDGNDEVVYRGYVDPKEETKSYTIYDASAPASLTNGSSYTVFVVVNYPGDLGVLAPVGTLKTNLDDLILREANAPTFLDADNVAPAGDDLSLVMTGVNTEPFTYNSANSVNEVDVDLKRLAAKVTLEFYVKDVVTPESSEGVTETWTPMTDGNNIRVYLCRGAKTVRLDGGIPGPTELDVNETTLFDYQSGPYYSTKPSEKVDFSHAFTSDAFYTYPRTWDAGDPDEPYLKLIIPWKVHRVAAEVETEYQKEFYYKVMLPAGLAGNGNGFKSNNWYRLVLDVDRVGSITEDAAVELICHYTVAGWNQQNITSKLVPGYYLDVNNGNLNPDVYATNVIEIPYVASGPVVLRVKYKTHTDDNDDGIADSVGSANEQTSEVSFYQFNQYYSNLSGDEQTNGRHKVYLPSGEGYTISLRESDHHIVITHELRDNYAANNKVYDVSPFEFTFTLGLENDPTGDDQQLYNKTVKVTQYPPLYIKQLVGGDVYVKGQTYALTSGGKVYAANGTTTYNNGAALSNSNADFFIGTITNPSPTYNQTSNPAPVDGTSRPNSSPYMVEVSATILKNFQFYLGPDRLVSAVIDDPRMNPGSNPYSLGLSGLDDSEYRPTAPGKENMVAPRFRVASSYGKTGATSYLGAVRRCAAYQEAGYPAGRWRLPTAAEVAFLMKLSDDGYILSLYDPEDMGMNGSNTPTYNSVSTYYNGYLGSRWIFVNYAYWAGGEWGRFYVATEKSHDYPLVWAATDDTHSTPPVWPNFAQKNTWPQSATPDSRYAFRNLSSSSFSVPFYYNYGYDPTPTYYNSWLDNHTNNYTDNNGPTNSSVGLVVYDYEFNHGAPDATMTVPKNILMYSRCVYDSWYWDELNQNTGRTTFAYKPVPATTQP